MLAKVVKEVKAHGSQLSDDLGEIYRVEKWKDNIVSFALDSYVKVWTKDLELIESKFLNGYNQISLTVDKDKLYIGDGNGTIRVFNAKFEQENTIKICEDSISDIKIIDEFLFATAFDGTIAAFNLITQQMNAVNVEGQLYQINYFAGKFYVAGTKSYQLDKNFTHIVEIERANRFLHVGDQIYGVSDRLGLFSLTKDFSTNEPCDVITVVGDFIVGVSDTGVTLFSYLQEGVSWKSQIIRSFKLGYQKRGIVSLNDKQFVVGGDSGRLYKLQLNDS